MTDLQLFKNMRAILDEYLSQLANCVSQDYGRLNETGIELNKRINELELKEAKEFIDKR